MLIPSLDCPASCKYCFGPYSGSTLMSQDIVELIVNWQNSFTTDEPIEITFHGGEPLVPGASFYNMALPLLKERLAPRKVSFGMQSNLWLLDENLCELFSEYNVSLGTSLDGPEKINDFQRGKNYFKRTMRGIEIAREFGINVACICTFTSHSYKYAEEIFDFFMDNDLNFTIHAAMPSIRHNNSKDFQLSAEEHGDLLLKSLSLYLKNMDKVRIGTLDSICRSISAGRGGICTFTDCLGDYLAVGPKGEIYPCQRFGGLSEYVMANVNDPKSLTNINNSPVWRMFQEYQENINNECSNCHYINYCRGGCPYNVLAVNKGSFHGVKKDPHCSSYQEIYSDIMDRAIDEVFCKENMDDVINRVDTNSGLLRKGKLLSIMGNGSHPYKINRQARRLVAAYILALTDSSHETFLKLTDLGLINNLKHNLIAIENFYQNLISYSNSLNKLYLHVTFDCNLNCSHCYANANSKYSEYLDVNETIEAIYEAASLGFIFSVITGGEPLIHPKIYELLDELSNLRYKIKPMWTVLRTNLALDVEKELLKKLSYSTDKLVVSVDGDKETHDYRRGKGNYDVTIKNLKELMEMDPSTEISIATTLPLDLVNGYPGESVRNLGHELGINVSFRPLLPIGRAVNLKADIAPDTIWSHMSPHEMVEYGFNPTSTCGIGQNLYVEPDGNAYPCYAWQGDDWLLGSINSNEGLSQIIKSNLFQDLATHTVDTNKGCRKCALRYLCGGACRAWNHKSKEPKRDLNDPPLDCNQLYKRASSLLFSALVQLQISKEKWNITDLPLPKIIK